MRPPVRELLLRQHSTEPYLETTVPAENVSTTYILFLADRLVFDIQLFSSDTMFPVPQSSVMMTSENALK